MAGNVGDVSLSVSIDPASMWRLENQFRAGVRKAAAEAEAEFKKIKPPPIAAPEVSGFLSGIKRLADGINESTSGLRKFGKEADGILKSIGLSTRDFAVLFGAGLAGGTLLALRSAIQFLGDAVKEAAQFNRSLIVTEKIFGSASSAVKEFASNAAEAFGLSENEALKAANAYGLVFTQIGISAEAAATLSAKTVELTKDLAAFSSGALTAEQIQQALSSAFIGEFDTLQRILPNISAYAIEQEALANRTTQSSAAVSDQEKKLAALSLAFKQGEIAAGAYAAVSGDVIGEQERLSAEISNLKKEIGQGLLPIYGELLRVSRDFVQGIRDIPQDIKNPFGFINKLLDAGQPSIEQLLEEQKNLQTESDDFSAQSFIDELNGIISEALSAADAVGTFSAAIAESQKVLITAKIGIASIVKQADAISSFGGSITNSFRQANAAGSDSAKAAKDNAKRIADAQKSLAKAQEDGGKRIEKARKSLAKVDKDTADKIRDSQKKLAKTYKDNQRDIEEATRQLVRARVDGVARIRDAEQELADFQADIQGTNDRTIEEARRLRDAEEQVADARQEFARNIEDAQRHVIEVQLQGVERLEEAQQAVADAQIDREEKLVDAMERVAEAQEDSADRIADAQERLAEAIATSAEKASKAAKDTIIDTASELKKVLQDSIADIETFNTSLIIIGEKVRRTGREEIVGHFLFELQKLGPEAAPLLKNLTQISDKELSNIVDLFAKKTQLSKDSMDQVYDKFPPNLRAKFKPIVSAITDNLFKIANAVEGNANITKDELAKAAKEFDNYGGVIKQMADEGVIHLSDIERATLDLGLASENPRVKSQALLDVLNKFSSVDLDIPINIKTQNAKRELIKFYRTLREIAAKDPLGGINVAIYDAILADLNRAQFGGRFKKGEFALVGEAGPEIVRFPANAEVIPNDRSRKMLGGNVNITVNEVAQDPRATAQAVAARLGFRAVR